MSPILERLLNNFDFERVRAVMEALNWTWADSDGVPSTGRMAAMVIGLWETCESNGWVNCASGGFMLQVGREEGAITSAHLQFIAAEGDTEV